MDARLGVLDVLLDEGDREDLLALVGGLARGSGDSTVEKRVELLEDGSALSRLGTSLATDAEVLLERVESGSAYRDEGNCQRCSGAEEHSTHPSRAQVECSGACGGRARR